MGCDWYSFTSHVAYGVLVPWKKIFQKLNLELPPSDLKNWKEAEFPKEAVLEELGKCRCDLFQEYFVYNVANAFALFSPSKINATSRMSLCGPYETTAYEFRVSVAPVDGCKHYYPLLEVARSFGKPQFLPGIVSINESDGGTFGVELLFDAEKNVKVSHLDERIPRDIIITDGTDSFKHNQDVLIHYGFGELVAEASKNNGTLDLAGTTASLQEVKKVIEKQTNRVMQTGKETKGDEGKKEDGNMPKYLTPKQESGGTKQDCTFVLGKGGSEVAVEANRAVLAHANPVLANMLYGTELLKVNPETPIKWDAFDPLAVKLVFQALTSLTHTVVEAHVKSAFLQVLDFLGESEDSVLWEDGEVKGALDTVSISFETERNGCTGRDWMVAPPSLLYEYYNY